MELFKVFGSLIIEDKDAIKSLNDTDKKAKETAVSVHNLTKKAAEMGKAVAIGAGVAVTALFGMATKSAQIAGDIDDAAQRVGLSAEEYQKWAYAAKLSGLEQDKLESVMKKQQTTFADATQGVTTASNAYSALGIDIKGLTSGGAFDKAVKALADMKDETKRNAIANDLFGKSYADLAPLLNSGSKGIEKLRNEAVELGAVMSNESVEAGALFGDQLDRVTQTFQTVVAEIGVKVMPMFDRFLNWVMRNMPTIKQTIENVMNGVSKAIAFVTQNAGWLIPVLSGVVTTLTTFSVLTSVSSGLKLMQDMLGGATLKMGLFNGVMAANPIGMVALAIGVLVAAIAVLWMNWDKVSQFFTSTFKTIQEGFEKFINGFIDGLNWIIEKANKVPGINIQKIGDVDLTPDKPKVIPKKSGGTRNTTIQAYASGGIAYGDTLARVGEYAGVKNNPEVIAPLDKLKGMLGNSMDYELLADLITDRMTKAMQKIAIVLDHTEVGTFVDKRIIRSL